MAGVECKLCNLKGLGLWQVATGDKSCNAFDPSAASQKASPTLGESGSQSCTSSESIGEEQCNTAFLTLPNPVTGSGVISIFLNNFNSTLATPKEDYGPFEMTFSWDASFQNPMLPLFSDSMKGEMESRWKNLTSHQMEVCANGMRIAHSAHDSPVGLVHALPWIKGMHELNQTSLTAMGVPLAKVSDIQLMQNFSFNFRSADPHDQNNWANIRFNFCNSTSTTTKNNFAFGISRMLSKVVTNAWHAITFADVRDTEETIKQPWQIMQ